MQKAHRCMMAAMGLYSWIGVIWMYQDFRFKVSPLDFIAIMQLLQSSPRSASRCNSLSGKRSLHHWQRWRLSVGLESFVLRVAFTGSLFVFSIFEPYWCWRFAETRKPTVTDCGDGLNGWTIERYYRFFIDVIYTQNILKCSCYLVSLDRSSRIFLYSGVSCRVSRNWRVRFILSCGDSSLILPLMASMAFRWLSSPTWV